MTLFLDWLRYPPRLAAIRKYLRTDHPRLLDVGCGNHSPTITKHYLPQCEYHGVDNGRWCLDADDDRNMERFYQVDLDDANALDAIPDDYFDAVICSHVLEHLKEPEGVVRKLSHKVGRGGLIFVEAPAAVSLRMPRTREGLLGFRGCLNFWDDATHRRVVDLKVVAQVLSESGFRVHGPRTRRVWRRILFMPIFMLGGLVRCGHIPSAVLWDLVGFAKMLVAVREPRRGWFESTTAIRAKGLLVNSVVGDGAEGPTAEDAQNTKERVPYRVRCCHLEERAGITSEHMHAQRVA